jgi:ligand-binding SRPBCC domain-containing protein
MADHTLEREQEIAASLPATFEFFSDAYNLEKITPPDVRFRILTPAPIAMHQGTLIDYWLHVFGVPFRWRTRITEWKPPTRFVDAMESGPYGKWVHSHDFAERGGATVVHDRVEYALPFGPLGEIAHPLVRRKLDAIFDFRAVATRRLLATGEGGR